MLTDGSLTFQEFAMNEPLPLATIHDAILEFLQGRDDAVVFGAQAVNAYVDQPRMTQDVDILSPRASELAEELQEELNQRFSIAVRIRSVADGNGYRLYQVRKPKNRHLADVRSVSVLPDHQTVEGIAVLTPAQLVSHKIVSMVSRTGTAKGLIDAADLQRLLLTFPKIKTQNGQVTDALREANASEQMFAAWHDLVERELLPDNDDDY